MLFKAKLTTTKPFNYKWLLVTFYFQGNNAETVYLAVILTQQGFFSQVQKFKGIAAFFDKKTPLIFLKIKNMYVNLSSEAVYRQIKKVTRDKCFSFLS